MLPTLALTRGSAALLWSRLPDATLACARRNDGRYYVAFKMRIKIIDAPRSMQGDIELGKHKANNAGVEGTPERSQQKRRTVRAKVSTLRRNAFDFGDDRSDRSASEIHVDHLRSRAFREVEVCEFPA